jgi:hypothetical protein
MTDPKVLEKAVGRIKGAQYLGMGNTKTYSGTNTGHIIKLPGWKYDVAVDVTTGECTFDNYNGSWGKDSVLDEVKQGYAIEAVKDKATREGHTMEEITLDDGSVKLVIPIGGSEMGVEGGGGDSSGWDVG